MKHPRNFMIAIIFGLLITTSCTREEIVPDEVPVASYEPNSGQICGTPLILDLIAYPGGSPGSATVAGTVTISNDATDLFISYATSGGWVLESTGAYAGNCSALPTSKSGVPYPALFPHTGTHSPWQYLYTYTIPLASLDSCYCLAATAEMLLLSPSGAVIQTATAWAAGVPFVPGLSVSSYTSYCKQPCDDCVINPGDFRTQTQDSWTLTTKSGGPAAYISANFSGAFPAGLTIGCAKTLTLTSDAAISDYIPESGTASELTTDYVDPGPIGNVLAGELVALTLSVGFDAYDPAFGGSVTALGDLIISSGAFAGWSVNDVLFEANQALGGCGTAWPPGDLSDIVSKINHEFDFGSTTGSLLVCP